MVRLVLASASAARLHTLQAAGIEPEVVVSGIDETQNIASAPADLALGLAQLKARAVAEQLNDPEAVVIACDSLLELDGQALGKPSDATEAVARWRNMRGRNGLLHTGHCVRYGPREVSRLASPRVHFGQVSDAEIADYVATGEPLQVAGAFTIDGLGGAFVEGVEGDPHAVVGISLPLLRELLGSLEVAWTDLWNRTDR